MEHGFRSSTVEVHHRRLGSEVESKPNGRGCTPGASDKISNKVDDLAGKVKEGAGKATADKSTENEGKVDQAKSSLNGEGEKVKDAFKK